MRPAICSTVYSCIRPEPQWNRLPELACQAHNGLWGSSKVNVFCKTWLWILDRISGWGNCKAKVSCWFGSDPIFSNLHEGKLMSASAKLYFHLLDVFLSMGTDTQIFCVWKLWIWDIFFNGVIIDGWLTTEMIVRQKSYNMSAFWREFNFSWTKKENGWIHVHPSLCGLSLIGYLQG